MVKNLIHSSLKNKNFLITGGTGSFGIYFIKHLLKYYSAKKIIIYSRDELKQSELKDELNQEFKNIKNVRFFIGDVRDYPRLLVASKNIDIIVHAAALKQVPTIEYNPFEAVKTNILGAQNIIQAAIENNVKKSHQFLRDKC